MCDINKCTSNSNNILTALLLFEATKTSRQLRGSGGKAQAVEAIWKFLSTSMSSTSTPASALLALGCTCRKPVDVTFLLYKSKVTKRKLAATFICYIVQCFNLGLYYPQNTDAAKRVTLGLFLFRKIVKKKLVIPNLFRDPIFRTYMLDLNL